MAHWVKRKSGVKGPFSKIQIEGFIETGRLPEGTLVSESPDGPWDPITIAHRDVAQEPNVDAMYESQKIVNNDDDSAYKRKLWSQLNTQMESHASAEALQIIDELETFHMTEEERSDLDSLRRSLLDGQESDDYVDHEDYQPGIRRAKRKRRHSSSDGHTTGQNGDCPFPGSLFENILLGASSGDLDAKNEFSSDWKRIFGVTYVVSFVLVALSVIIMAFRADVPISQFSFLLLGLSLGALVMTALHYATHAALDLNVTLLQSPIFRISSVRHLHIVATPLVVFAVVSVYFATFSLYSAIQSTAGDGNLASSSTVQTSAATLVLAMSLSFVILRAALNPQQLGVLVSPKATAGETVLGLSAIFVRAPAHAIPIVYPLGLGLVLSGSFAFVLMAVGIDSEWMGVILIVAIAGGLFFMAWPLCAYAFCLFSVYSIEIVQCLFSICRNVESISNPDVSD